MYSCITIMDEPNFPFNKDDIKAVGRYKRIYNNKTYICDVIFSRLDNPFWSKNEKEEYLYGNNGYYHNWTYDITSTIMREIVMEWVNELDYEKRTIRNILRHIMTRMSSNNSGDKGLIVGKWEGIYTHDGKPPSHWINSSSIFEERKRTGKPVKYGQCWCFAECLTSICRFLGIACRTVSGKNTMIDENLDNGIDFKEDLRKSSDNTRFILLTKESLNESLNNLINGIVLKSEPWEELRIYDAGDSFWNIHYWNEVWIPNNDNKKGEWEIIDSTPISKTITNDDYSEMKISGPSRISDFSNKEIESSPESFDFLKLFSMINSPYRLWTIETIVENDEIITIPFVYSIIYPWNEKISVFIRSKSVLNLFKNTQSISTRKCGVSSTIKEDITNYYKSPSSKIMKLYFKNSSLDGIFYIQVVYLDKLGNVLKVERKHSTISDMKSCDENVDILNCYIISYLMIELSASDDRNNQKKWITFLKYNE